MSKICLAVAEPTPQKMLQVIEEQVDYFDIVEIRADALEGQGLSCLNELKPLFEQNKFEVMWTVRWQGEGGPFKGSEEERKAWLQYGDDHGADWVDVEAFSPLGSMFKPRRAKLIHSFHDFDHCPVNLEEVARQMASMSNDLIKLAVASKSTHELRRCIELYTLDIKKPLIAIAMGEWGESSRVLPAILNMPWTYASADHKPTAPGQFTAKQLRTLYRLHEVNDQTRVNVVIGDPVAHSLSPDMHNGLYVKEKLNALYGRIHVDDMSEFYQIAELLKIEGVSVTIPHKEALMTYVPQDTPLYKIGAANTLSKASGTWNVYNTDIEAAMAALREQWNGDRAAKVLIFGAGGVSRALGYGIQDEGWELTVTNRTFERANELSKELNCKVLPWEDRCAEGYDILINGTLLGMEPNEETSPIDLNGAMEQCIVFDTVYTPEKTMFLKAAAACGAKVISGREMFYRQGALQHHHWFGGEVPYRAMREIVSSLA